MTAKKSSKKRVYTKGATKSQIARTKQSRFISFFVGVVTVVIIAFLAFQFIQTNNYTQVLGEKTNIESSK